MSYEETRLTELMIRYPFSRQSRRFFEKLPVEESLTSAFVLKQAERRLLSALGRSRYESHLSEQIEFMSFFVGAIVASQDQNLAEKFSAAEGERAKKFFTAEDADDKAKIAFECLDLEVHAAERGARVRREFLVAVQDYLSLSTRLQLNRLQRWKLVNQALSGGVVHFTENLLNDFFGDAAQKTIYEGVARLKKGAFPRELANLRDAVLQYLPPPKVKSTKSYVYIEELMKHPASDGRHRATWLLLAPYLVTILQLSDEDAVGRIREFVAPGGETSQLRRFIEYNVRRARRLGLKPPTLSKLKAEHPDLYALLPKEVIAANSPTKKSANRG